MTTIRTLVVGFHDTEQRTLLMLKDLVFAQLDMQCISRVTTAEHKLQLPPHPKTAVDFYIIDLAGVGLSPQDNTYPLVISEFTDNKPAIFVTRYTPEEWQGLVATHTQFLPPSYNRIQMQTAIQQAMQAVPQSANTSLTQNPLTSTLASPVTRIEDMPVLSEELIIEKNFTLLAQTFKGIDTSIYFQLFKQIQQLSNYAVVQLGQYAMYINPFEKSVIANRLTRFIDHLTVIQNMPYQQDSFSIQILTVDQYNHQIQPLLEAGEQKILMSQMIWQMGLEGISPNQYNNSHELRLKAKYMPNLASIRYVPNYVATVIASCLGKTRQLRELHLLFSQLTNGQLNQVIILMIFSNIIDSSILLAAHDITQPKNEINSTLGQNDKIHRQESTKQNTGITQARQTGFFRRLLSKLNF